MTSEEYIKVRGLHKWANKTASLGTLALNALGKLVGGVAGMTTSAATTAVKGAAKAAAIGVPATGLLTAWLAYKATSPQAAAEMAPEFATHALERESLLQSMRDLEQAELTNKIQKSKRRVHDQFL